MNIIEERNVAESEKIFKDMLPHLNISKSMLYGDVLAVAAS